jgi:insulysin
LKAKLYTEMVCDALKEYAYDAELANLTYAVSRHLTGMQIIISGYDEMFPVLLEKVLVTMRDLEVEPCRFEVVKERLSEELGNFAFMKPYEQIIWFTRWLDSGVSYVSEQLFAELPSLAAADIKEFYPRLFRQMHIEVFVHGNMYKEDALTLSRLVESTFKPRSLPQIQWPVARSIIFPSGSNFIYHRTLTDTVIVDHCIKYLLFIGEKMDSPTRAKTLLLDQMTSEPAFDQLQTKEQLGYVIFSGTHESAIAIGYSITIQSEKELGYVEERIDTFFSNYIETIVTMTESDFEGHKRSLIKQRLEKTTNPDKESRRLWLFIEGGYLDFELGQPLSETY